MEEEVKVEIFKKYIYIYLNIIIWSIHRNQQFSNAKLTRYLNVQPKYHINKLANRLLKKGWAMYN